jgi:succinate dehydrogenase/fumarate reductase iron-sulfur protein
MKLKIQKYNPLTDPEPYYVEGEVEYRKNITALDAVYLFHANVGPLNFDYSCGGRICGRCSVMVDGSPALLCMTVLDDSTHTIEPLAGFPVIHDLVVDKSSFEEVMTNISNRTMLEPITKETVVPKDFVNDANINELLAYGELCCRCGMCQVTCPALASNPSDYAGPAQMYAIGYRHLDWYDKENRIAQAVGAGMYHCIQCGRCTEVCAYNLPHLKMWELLRAKAKEADLVPSYAK